MDFDTLVKQARRAGKNVSDPVTFGDIFAAAGSGNAADVADDDAGEDGAGAAGRGSPMDRARAGNPLGAGGFSEPGDGAGAVGGGASGESAATGRAGAKTAARKGR